MITIHGTHSFISASLIVAQNCLFAGDRRTRLASFVVVLLVLFPIVDSTCPLDAGVHCNTTLSQLQHASCAATETDGIYTSDAGCKINYKFKVYNRSKELHAISKMYLNRY